MDQKYANQSTDYDVFLTGASGLIGRWLVPELTRRGARVLALLRNARGRSSELRSWIDAHGGDASRVEWLDGDLDQPGLGLAAASADSLRRVRHVFHLGASFGWKLDRAAAQRTNVLGTRRVLDLAAALPALEHVVLVAGYRAAERISASGQRYRASARELARAGAYEASKLEAHRQGEAYARELGLPTTTLHPCSVIGDARTGETTQLTGLGESIVALARGQLPARVGSPRVLLPVVTVDLVARVLAEMAGDRTLFGKELTLLDPSTPEFDVLIDRAAALLGVRAPQLRLPVWFVRLLPERLTRVPRETLEFLDVARYATEESDAWLAAHGLAHAEFGPAFDRWVQTIVRQHVPELQLTPATAHP